MLGSKAKDRWDSDIAEQSCRLSNAINLDKKKPTQNILVLSLFRDAICRERKELERDIDSCIEPKRIELLEEYKSKLNGQFNKIRNGLPRM